MQPFEAWLKTEEENVEQQMQKQETKDGKESEKGIE